MRRALIVIALAMLAMSGLAASTGSNPYVINHALTAPDPSPQPTVLLDDDELFEIHVENTDTKCFTYNFGKAPEKGTTKKGLLEVLPTTVIVLRHPHVDGIAAYQVVIAKRKDAPKKCLARPIGTWTIPVLPRWNVAMTGAFSQDGLTSHRWYLEDGTSKVDGVDTKGFFVRRQKGASDQVNSSFAAMIHLFRRSSNGALRHWAPISFGLGLKDQNNAAFFAGTSFRIGQKFFLTGGIVSGKVDRLPNGVSEDGFVTSSNAINTLASRTRFAPFIAFSYSFLNVPVSFFQGKIPVQPKPAGGTSEDEEGGEDEDAESPLTPTGGKPGTKVEISGTGFGTTKGSVKFGELVAKILSWSDTKIDVEAPAFTADGEVDVTVAVGAEKINVGKFEAKKKSSN